MTTVGHVVALSPERDELDPIRSDLVRAGIHADVRPAQPGAYAREDTSLPEHLWGARRGLALGLVVGAAVGLVLVLVVPGLRELPLVGKVLLMGGIGLQGTIPAMMWLMGRVDHYDDDPAEDQLVTEGDPLLVVDDEHDEYRARHLLARHHAVFLAEDAPHAPVA